MSERVAVHFNGNDAPEKDVVAIGIEAVDSLLDVETQLRNDLQEFAAAEVAMMHNDEVVEYRSFNEMYRTSYDPEKTIPEIGRRGMAAVIELPQVDSHLAAAAVQVVDKDADVITINAYKKSKEQPSGHETIVRANGLAYAQDQLEYRGFAGQARAIIDALMRGDETSLGALPPRFQVALSERIASYDIVSIDEYEAMISVACNGLAGS